MNESIWTREIFNLIQIGLSFLVGVCVSAIINHFLAKDRDRQIRGFIDFNAAAREFREAFLGIHILLDIRPPTDPAIGNEWQKTIKLVRRFYQQHRAAVRKFEDLISSRRKIPLRESWYEYCCYDKQNNCETFSDYESETMEEEFKKRHLAISRVEKLLSFAKT